MTRLTRIFLFSAGCFAWVGQASLAATESTVDATPEKINQVEVSPTSGGPFLEGGLSANVSAGSTLLEGLGVGWSLSAGYAFKRVSVAATFQQYIGLGMDFGLLGGGLHRANLLGIKSDYNLIDSQKHRFRVGASLSKIWTRGYSGVFLLPVASVSFSSWALGPNVQYTYMISEVVGLGLNLSYLYILPADADHNTRVSFSHFDASLTLELRPFSI